MEFIFMFFCKHEANNLIEKQSFFAALKIDLDQLV